MRYVPVWDAQLGALCAHMFGGYPANFGFAQRPKLVRPRRWSEMGHGSHSRALVSCSELVRRAVRWWSCRPWDVARTQESR